MLLLELAAQAVRGFSPSIRIALKPGYTALKSPSDLPAPLAGLIVALSFPDGRGGDAAFLAPGQKSGRAGLSLQGNDGTVWRIVRDLGGAGGLHKLNRATNQFELVSQEAGEMAQALRSGAGFPAKTTWEQLFTITGPQLPTRRPKGPAAAPGKGATSGSMKALPRVVSVWNTEGGEGGTSNPAVSAEDLAKLPALEAELATARRAAEVQFRFDGVSSELYEAEAKMKTGDSVAQQLKAARAELEAFDARVGSLPEDILVRAQRHADDRRKYEEQLQQVREQAQAIIDNQPIAPPPLVKNQQFLGALFFGVALYVSAMFLEGGLRWLALLAMVPFSLAALFALRHIEDLQGFSRQGGKGEVLASREKKLTDDFQLASMVVQKALQQVGTSTTEEFLTFMGRKGELLARTTQLEAELAAVEQDPEYIALGEKVARLKGEHEKLNQELLGMSGGYVRDARDIEREIARIKEPPKAAAPPPPAAAGGFTPVPTGPTEHWDDPMPPLMMLATDLFATDVPSLWSVLHDRAVQYVTALTDRRFHGIQLDKDGHATLEAPGRTVSARELVGKDLDLVFLAMRLTLIEKAAAQHKLPVVIEDTFNTVLDAAKAPLFGRMVKHLGSLTQVLHVSGAGQNAAVADAPVAI